MGRPGRLHRRERARRHRGAVGHPGLDGRDAGPERRRLRPGGRADDHRRPRLRPRREVASGRSRPEECGFAYRDSRLKRDPARFVVLDVTFALDAGAVPPGRLRGAGADARRRDRARRRRWPTSATRSSSCAGARAWSSTRPIPTAAAPAPSSPTRSSRRSRRSTAARAGRPATASSSSAPPGWSSPPASAAARGTGNVGTSSRHSLALTTETRRDGDRTARVRRPDRRRRARSSSGSPSVPEPTAGPALALPRDLVLGGLGERPDDHQVDVHVVRPGDRPGDAVGDVLGDQRLAHPAVDRVRRVAPSRAGSARTPRCAPSPARSRSPAPARRSAPAAASRPACARRASPPCTTPRPRRRSAPPSS